MAAKLLKKDVEKLIVLKDLFPKSSPNFKTGLSEYQVKKIRAAIRLISNIFPTTSQIVPMGGGRRAYNAENGLPSYVRGIPLPGGTKINSYLSYSVAKKTITHQRGGKWQEHYQLDVSGTRALKKSAKLILKNRDHRLATVTFFGRALGAVRPTENDVLLIKEMLYFFNKYVKHAGEIIRGRDQRGRTVYKLLPEQWEMGILFEGEKNSRF